MPIYELKVRILVPKRFRVEQDDARFPSLVIGMTVATPLALYCGIHTVKALSRNDVFCDVVVIVTVRTQLVLLVPIEFCMARVALSLEFNMRLDNRPRHQQLIEYIGNCRYGQNHRQNKKDQGMLEFRTHH